MTPRSPEMGSCDSWPGLCRNFQFFGDCGTSCLGPREWPYLASWLCCATDELLPLRSSVVPMELCQAAAGVVGLLRTLRHTGASPSVPLLLRAGVSALGKLSILARCQVPYFCLYLEALLIFCLPCLTDRLLFFALRFHDCHKSSPRPPVCFPAPAADAPNPKARYDPSSNHRWLRR